MKLYAAYTAYIKTRTCEAAKLLNVLLSVVWGCYP